MGRPWWQDDYWKKMDWRQERRMRTICPFCGSDRTYYNEKYKTWKCLKCEKSFIVEDLRPTKYGVPARKAPKPKDEFVEHWERQGKPPTAYKPSKGISRSSRFPGWLKPILAVAILVMFTVVVWGLWGSQIASFFSSVSTSPPMEVSQPPFSTAPYTPVCLVNNKAATDPTWQELIAFLRIDNTDGHPYIFGSFMCGSFAEMLHNNAEEAGIKAAWVHVDFEGSGEGHALNAFNTTDRGLVYLDCVGEFIKPIVPLGGESVDFNYDKVAYVEIDNEYGLISLYVAESPQYTFYEQYIQQWESYESDLDAYSNKANAYIRMLAGRTVISDPSEYARLKSIYDELEALRSELEIRLELLGGCRWESLGVVTDIEIYW